MARRTKKTRYSFPPVESLKYGEHDSQTQNRDWDVGLRPGREKTSDPCHSAETHDGATRTLR